MARFLALLAFVGAGCASTHAEVRAPVDAPRLEPTSEVALAPGPPEGAVHLGNILVRRGLFADAQDCEARIVAEAERLGATHATVERHHHFLAHAASYHVKNETFDGCEGSAYYLPPSAAQIRR